MTGGGGIRRRRWPPPQQPRSFCKRLYVTTARRDGGRCWQGLGECSPERNDQDARAPPRRRLSSRGQRLWPVWPSVRGAHLSTYHV